MIKRIAFLLTFVFFLSSCSAFQVRQTLENGESKTYITDRVFVGTGTVLDCLISPVHLASGLFYAQSYIHVKGGNVSYPRVGGSGCFAGGYSKGQGLLSFFGIFNFLLISESSEGPTQVYFVDTNGKERMISGGNFEITRLAPTINLDLTSLLDWW